MSKGQGKGKVTVLGVNGHIGQAVARAFAAAGWDVTGIARTEKHAIAGVRFVAGNSDSVDDMRAAISDAEVVVNALNLPYPDWFEGRMEAQMARVVEAMGQSGKTLLFPGNIYNFAASNREVTPELAQHPETVRGAVRVRVEEMFEAAAARGDIQTIILRAGSFFGPGTGGDWFDLVMFREISKGKVSLMGTSGVGHNWAYLPDLARAFEALASLRLTLGPFERFHFSGNFVTPEQMGAAIAAAAPRPLKFGRFPLLLIRLMGLFDPMMREIGKMNYLWQSPMQLVDGRFDALLGEGFATPFPEAVATTVAPFLAKLPAR
jgi:nucleoside-diphosphate-sugar epimerase